MATIKIILDKRKANKFNQYPIAFMICEGRKTTTRSFKKYISTRDWDEDKARVRRSHPQSAEINKQLAARYDQLYKEVVIGIPSQQSETLVKPIGGQAKASSALKIHEFGQQLITKLKAADKVGNAWVYEYTLTALKKYDPNLDLTFEQIDYSYLTAYQEHLEALKLKHNTIYLYLRTIRIFFNKAIKAKLIDRDLYPFHDIQLKPGKTPKRAVDTSIIKSIKSIELKPNTSLWHSRNRFMLIFYLIGISFIDLTLLKHSDYKNGRITYKHRKTGRWYDIKVQPEAKEIIDLYRDRSSTFLLGIASEKASTEEQLVLQIKQENKNTNDHLTKMLGMIKIEAKVTTYSARHSWATICKRLGFSNELIAEALGHEYGNRTTAIYLDTFEQSVVDDVNEKVINSIF